jgi:hypothetical protein
MMLVLRRQTPTFFVRVSGATNATLADSLGRATIVDNG